MSKVFLAAGHYPTAPGAGFEGFFEHDEASRWVTLLDSMAQDLLHVVPTGTLKTKAQFINARCQPGDIAVELHFNSAENANGEHIGQGSVTLYCPGSNKGQRLADCMQNELAKVFSPNRGIVEGWFRGDRDRGVYYFLERTNCPAVILEPEFVHRRAIIQSNRAAGCAAILAGLRTYLGLSQGGQT